MTAERLAEKVRTRPVMAWLMLFGQMADLYADGLRVGGGTLWAAISVMAESIARLLTAPLVAAALAWCLVKTHEREPERVMEYAKQLCEVYEIDEE